MTFDSAREVRRVLDPLGIRACYGELRSFSPIDGQEIGQVQTASAAQVGEAVSAAHSAFLAWREVPPPRRGELVRLFGEVLREEKEALGRLVSLEAGKIL